MTTATRPMTVRPTGLTVLYDAGCPVCRRARRWVERQRQLVPVRFVAAGSPRAQHRFPQLDVGSTLVEVTVITDEGAVFRGERAWVAVLWAVARTRTAAIDVARGRKTRAFRRVKGATDLVRRLAAGQPDAVSGPAHGDWPPPRPGGACAGCET